MKNMWADDWDDETEKSKVSESIDWGDHVDKNKTDVNKVLYVLLQSCMLCEL